MSLGIGYDLLRCGAVRTPVKSQEVHEQQRRERVFAQVPEALAANARALVSALGTLEEEVWNLTRTINTALDSSSAGTMSLLSQWVESAQALAHRNAALLKQGEDLVAACRELPLPEELVMAMRDRIAPFLDDIAQAQQQFREAAERAADRNLRS